MLSEWRGITCQHRSDDFPIIINIITEHRPTIVVELGTDVGGFASLLADTVAPWGGHVHTFDITDKSDVRLSRHANLSRHLADVLSEPNEHIASLVKDARVFLYTDNGNKMREIALYAPLLGLGSLLGTHDYEDEVDPAWVEPFLRALGYVQEGHARMEALRNEWYRPLTRFWRRQRKDLAIVHHGDATHPVSAVMQTPTFAHPWFSTLTDI